jgi:hypothetical protein
MPKNQPGPNGPQTYKPFKANNLRHGCRVSTFQPPKVVDHSPSATLVGELVEVEVKKGLIIPCIITEFRPIGRSFRVAPVWGRGSFGVRREKIIAFISEETLLDRYQLKL